MSDISPSKVADRSHQSTLSPPSGVLMPDQDVAFGVIHEQHVSDFATAAVAEHWLVDPGQLKDWQGQLVNSCHAINDQLTQIQQELKTESAQTLRLFGPSPGDISDQSEEF